MASASSARRESVGNHERLRRLAGTHGQTEIERVRAATDLVRVVGEHVALRQKGREYVGLCPFHDDRSPSMHVVVHKGEPFYKCFACGASGDCFTFVMEYHKMSFGEAIRYLADRAGIELEPFRPEAPAAGGATSGRPGRDALLKANAFACTFFEEALAGPDGAEARAAIEARGIRPETAATFRLGYAPGRPRERSDVLLRRLGDRASSIRIAEAAGLLRAPESGGRYDTFRHRLVFPICDEVGRPIAFGGRIIDPEDGPKYLNSPESDVFHKSRTLYGLHLARRAIVEARTAIVVEGYTDVVACHQAGVTNAVATLGTALTEEHARRLARLCDGVVLVFDGDEAGMRAADRGVEIFFREPVDIRICVLPGGIDPADLLGRPDGREQFAALVAGATDALAYKLRRFADAFDADAGISTRQKAVEEFLQSLADLGVRRMQGVRRAMITSRIADLLRVPIADVERSLGALKPRSGAAAEPRGAEPSARADAAPTLADATATGLSRARRIAERELLGLLVFSPAADAPLAAGDPVGWDAFADPACLRVATALHRARQEGETPPLPRLLGRLADETARDLAGTLFFEGRSRCEDDESIVPELVAGAAVALRACIERESNDRDVAAYRSDANGDAARALELIHRRREGPDLPAAIQRGLRSR